MLQRVLPRLGLAVSARVDPANGPIESGFIGPLRAPAGLQTDRRRSQLTAERLRSWLPWEEVGVNIVEGYLLACWFFGVSGIIDVLLQPRRAFHAVERSKLKWLGIELAGAPAVGIFTWGYYAFKIRPTLLRAGGRRPRALLRLFIKMQNPEFWQPANSRRPTSPTGGTSATVGQGFPSHAETTRICNSEGCSFGRVTCRKCQGSGQQLTYGSSSQPHVSPCPACGGEGKQPHHACGGTGRVPA
jgi:hypothetical protein